MSSAQLQDLTLRLVTRGFKEGSTKVNNLRSSIQGANSATKASSATQKKHSKTMVDTGHTYASTNKEMAKATATINTQKRAISNLTGKGGGGFLGLNDSMDKTIKKVALWTISTGVIFGTLRALKAMGETIEEHDSNIIGLRKVYSGWEGDLAGIEKSVFRVSRAMQSTTGSAFEAATVVARTGRVRLDVVELTEKALIAENIAELDAAKGILFLNSALIQFNQTTDQTLRVLDEWNELSNKTPATTQDLAMAVSVAGSVFEQAGASIQFLNANTAALVEITAKSGNIIGRAERTMAIYARRQSTVNLLARQGITVFEGVNKEFIGIDELLTRVAAKWGGMNDQWKAAIAQSIAGARQTQFFTALMENQDIVLTNLITQWQSYGSAVKENEMFLESIKKKTDGLINSFERLALKIGDAGVKDILLGIINALTLMVNAFIDANVAMQTMAATTGLLIGGFAVLSAGMGTVGALALAFGTFMATLTALNGVMDTTAKRTREQEELDRERLTTLGKQQARLNSIVETLSSMQRAREQLNAEGKKSDELEARIARTLKVLKEIYPDIATELNTLEGAYKTLNTQLETQNRLLFEQRKLTLENRLATVKAGIAQEEAARKFPLTRAQVSGRVLPSTPKADTALTQARDIKSQDRQKALEKERDDLNAELDDLIFQRTTGAGGGGGAGGGPTPDADVNMQIARLKEQQEIQEMILAGKRDEVIIAHELVGLQERLATEAMSLGEVERVKLQILQKQVQMQQIMLADAAKIASVISRGLSDGIAGSFDNANVQKAMHGMVRGFGNLLSTQITESITQSMVAAQAGKVAIGLATGFAGGAVSGLLGLLANSLFGNQSESDQAVEATEENTVQLRALNDNINDLTSFFVNAPSNFAVASGGNGLGGGGASAVAAGSGGGGVVSMADNRQLTLAKGSIQVNQQPGQSGAELGASIESGLVDAWDRGGQSHQSY